MRVGKHYRLFRHPLFTIDQGNDWIAPVRIEFRPEAHYGGVALDPGLVLSDPGYIVRGSFTSIQWTGPVYVLGAQVGFYTVNFGPINDIVYGNEFRVFLSDLTGAFATTHYRIRRGDSFWNFSLAIHTAVVDNFTFPWTTAGDFVVAPDSSYTRTPRY